MSRRRSARFWSGCLLAYAILLAAVSLLPGGDAAPLKWDSSITPTMQDIGHVLAYAILALLALGMARASHRLSVAGVVLIFVACCGLGALLEAGQWFIPGRTCSPSDALANVAGVAAGTLFFWAFRGFRIHVDLPITQDAPGAGKARVCMLVTNDVVDDPRVLFEAEALAQAGYAVTVIGWDRTADADHVLDRNGFRIVQLKLRSTHGRGLTQPFFLAGFWLRAWPVVRQINPQVIHCHDLDTLPLGRWASRRLGAKLVFDAHENFPDMMVGHLPTFAVNCLRRVERRLAPRCDTLITVGELLAEFYRSLGARRVVVVGNWKDPADFKFPPEEIARTRAELGIHNGRLAVCYIANLGRERRIEPLLQAVGGDSRFMCVIGGDGPQADLVRQYAARHDNIRYLGRVPPRDVPRITAACDILYYGFDETNPNARWSAPNKLFEAIAAGKPILTGDFGEIGDTVRKTGCGAIADTRDAEGIAQGLAKLTDPDGLKYCTHPAQDLYSRREAVRRLIGAYAKT